MSSSPPARYVRAAVRRLRPFLDVAQENRLIDHANAIAFNVLLALIPLLLAGVALLGFVGLEEVWEQEAAPIVEEELPEDAFALLDRTIQDVLGSKQGLWLTTGAGFALWQLSGAVRATMKLLNSLHGEDERRSGPKRFALSLALAAVIAPCTVLAAVGLAAGDELVSLLELGVAVEAVLFVVRWTLGLGLLFAAVWLLLRFAPYADREERWVSVGAGLVVGGWLLASLLFGLYLEHFASYGSVYGGLASIFVLLVYVNILALVFVAGAQAEAIMGDRAQERS